MRQRIRFPYLLLSLCFSFLLHVGPGSLQAQVAQSAPRAGSSADNNREDPLAAADEVLRDMSQITSLPLREPLRKSLRSRDEIRAYVLREMKEEKSSDERYAAEKEMEAFGLVPKGFELEPFLVDLLTEQIAGLYDPKAHEFYIADWIVSADKRMVMAHELTHALEDQSFHIEAWLKAARPNDDAEMARDAVLEGSANAAMVDYILHGTGRTVWELPEIDPELFLGDTKSSPKFSSAPRFIQDTLLFPYIAGLNFTKEALRQKGWSGLAGLFATPPASSQQILHPDLYRRGVKPANVALPDAGNMLGREWKRLDENVLGEFGVKEVLLQFLGAERAGSLSSAWVGDRYALFEGVTTKKLLLIFRLQLATPEDAARFAGQYSEALEKKYAQRRNLFRRPNYFSFDSVDGGVFLRCVSAECFTLEGGDEQLFERLTKAMGWLPGQVRPKRLESEPAETTLHESLPPIPVATSAAPAAFAP